MNEDNTPRQERNQTESEAVSFGVNVLGDNFSSTKDGNEGILDSIGEGSPDLSDSIGEHAETLADSAGELAGAIAESIGECAAEVIGSLLD